MTKVSSLSSEYNLETKLPTQSRSFLYQVSCTRTQPVKIHVLRSASHILMSIGNQTGMRAILQTRGCPPYPSQPRLYLTKPSQLNHIQNFHTLHKHIPTQNGWDSNIMFQQLHCLKCRNNIIFKTNLLYLMHSYRNNRYQ